MTPDGPHDGIPPAHEAGDAVGADLESPLVAAIRGMLEKHGCAPGDYCPWCAKVRAALAEDDRG